MTETLTPQRTFEPAPPPPPDTTTPAAPRKVTVADVLERAAYRIEEDIEPWCQGIREGSACVGYAISRAQREIGFTHPATPPGYGQSWFGWAESLLGVDSIPRWNDAPGRTKAEVISALRAAASSARTKEEGLGKHAKLEVVEIPADVEWEIDEYDGLERVAEAHRVWS